jgi:hypothetical protein
MKMITASELQKHLKTYLREAQSQEIVVTLEDGTLVGLSGLEPEDLADAEFENDPRFAQLIAERRNRYQQAGGISFDQVQQALIVELTQDLDHPDPAIRQEATDLLAALGKSQAARSSE